VKPSPHKVFVFAGFGCGGLMAGLMILGLFVARNEEAKHPRSRPVPAVLVPVAALDSLRNLDVRSLLGQSDPREALAPQGNANGAVPALAVWRGQGIATLRVAFGDTFPTGSTERQAWLAAGASYFVDTLVRAALQPWRLAAAAPDSGDALVPTLRPNPVLTTVRAMLARVQLDLTARRRSSADTVLRAVMTIAYALEADARLSTVVLGARIERDAADMRARHRELWRGESGPRVRAALARADASSHLLGRLQTLAWVAGTAPDNALGLAELAADPRPPVAVRRELVRVVADGWIQDPEEMSRGISRKRREALERLQQDALPPEVRAAVRAALAFRDPGMLGRFRRMIAYTQASAT
jgi:hypothetical protein